MSNRFDAMDMSELEREFEFEMEAESDDEFEGEFEEEFEFELDDEFEFEADDEFEGMEDQEYGNDYAERFYELSQRQFESESEVDTAINEVLDDMEREYFFGKALRGIKNIAKKVSKNQVFKPRSTPLKAWHPNILPSKPCRVSPSWLEAICVECWALWQKRVWVPWFLVERLFCRHCKLWDSRKRNCPKITGRHGTTMSWWHARRMKPWRIPLRIRLIIP
jgi:hypothetical protein